MRIISAYTTIVYPSSMTEVSMLRRIEAVARTCYKSEDKITSDSYIGMIKGLIKRGHEAMLEHGSVTVKFVCDRGVSHELVRHRLASFAQESTRYCNYSQDKFGNELKFIWPCFFGEYNEKNTAQKSAKAWQMAMLEAERRYFEMLGCGCTPQEARSVLPNSIKTEVVMTANFREWRHFFKLRALRETGPAHPQMEELAVPLLYQMETRFPPVFQDLREKADKLYV